MTNHFSNIFGKEAFTERLPDSLRLLLVAAILIDTGNLKPAPSGKATHRDRQAMATLTSSQQIQEPMISSSSDDLFTRLREAKSDVSSLSLRNHFRRDYKLLVTSNGCTVGLSSALLSLQELAAKDGWPGLARALLDWAQERSLDVAAVLTNFRRDGKSKRELLFLPKAEALRDILLQLPTSRSNGVADLRLRLWSTDDLDQYGFIVFDQLNDKATRKQVSPAVRAAIEDTYGARQL